MAASGCAYLKKIQEKHQDSCYLPDKARDLAYEFIEYTDFSGMKNHIWWNV